MSRASTDETVHLKEMVQQQINRLICQMKDLDECADLLTEEEIRETRAETMEEMHEFDESLRKLMKGDMTLMTELGSMRLALMAAINEAFKTPDVIRMFNTRETQGLRQSLSKLKEQHHLKAITDKQFEEKATELLTALKSLNEPLSDEEAAFLSKQMAHKFSGFSESSNNVSQENQRNLIREFGDQARARPAE